MTRVDFFMIRVDPSPILFDFYFFIQSESIRVDPTRTGGALAELGDFHLLWKNTYQTESDEAKNREVSACRSMYSFS